MTFNIQHALDYKKKIINTNLFARKIAENHVDICGLNEVRSKGPLLGYTDQMNAIRKKLDFQGYFAKAIMVNDKAPYGNAIVSRYPITSAETIMIPDPENKDEDVRCETRCVLKSLIDFNGKEICVLVCHMGLSDAERKNAVETLCGIIDNADLPLILMGDFNAEPDDTVFDPLYERLSDSDLLSDVKSQPTFPSYAPEKKIDYILYRGLKCKSVRTVNEVISDHCPIVAEFSF